MYKSIIAKICKSTTITILDIVGSEEQKRYRTVPKVTALSFPKGNRDASI